jgi:putative transposase
MILTYKIKHDRIFSDELCKARKIAWYAIRTKSRTSKDVKHIGLKSAIANQILKKYGRKNIKKVNSVKLIIPGQSVKLDSITRTAHVSCLNLDLNCKYLPDFLKIKQIEIGPVFAYASIEICELDTITASRFMGVDCNTTGHVVVAAMPHTGKVHKFGSEALHIRNKYKNIRKKLQKQGKFSMLSMIKSRESNILRNLNHRISKKLVDIAVSERLGIRFEKLKNIRNNKKHHRSFRYSLNSWSYYQLQKFTEYKARKKGIEVAYVAPAYTSQICSDVRVFR